MSVELVALVDFELGVGEISVVVVSISAGRVRLLPLERVEGAVEKVVDEILVEVAVEAEELVGVAA